MSIEEVIKTAVKEAVLEAMGGQKAANAPMYTPPEKPMLSTAEAAKHLGIPQSAVIAMTHRADCDFCVVDGSRRRILSHRLMAYMERQADERKGTTE